MPFIDFHILHKYHGHVSMTQVRACCSKLCTNVKQAKFPIQYFIYQNIKKKYKFYKSTGLEWQFLSCQVTFNIEIFIQGNYCFTSKRKEINWAPLSEWHCELLPLECVKAFVRNKPLHVLHHSIQTITRALDKDK